MFIGKVRKVHENFNGNSNFLRTAASIILLVIGTVCSFTVSLCLSRLMTFYGDHCILDARTVLEDPPKEPTTEYKPTFRRMPPTDKSSEDSEFYTKPYLRLDEVFDPDYAKYLADDPKTELPRDQVFALYMSNETVFAFQDVNVNNSLIPDKLNEKSSGWGASSRCDYGIYTPICQCCFAIIITTMFVICGKGGRGDENAYLSEPWRIVSPALVFFIVMTGLSIANLVVIEGGIDTFCESLKGDVKGLSSSLALNGFIAENIDYKTIKIPPSKLRTILSSFNYITFVCWFTSMLVLIARIIFVIDFQLVRVTVKSMEYENVKTSTNFKVIQEAPSGKQATTQC